MPRNSPLRRTGNPRGRRRAISAAVRRLCLLGAALIAIATVLALFAEAWWVAELFTHFRVQYILAAGVIAVSGFAYRLRIAALAMLACIVVNAAAIYTYLPLFDTARAGASRSADNGAATLRLISVNVRARNSEPQRLLDLVGIERPDVLLVLEHTPLFDAALEALHDYPYRLTLPLHSPFGIGLYSRQPLAEAALFKLGATDAIRATVHTPSGDVTVIGVHLLPPMNAPWAAERNAQLSRIAETVAGSQAQTIVCGDFNLTPYSPYFSRLLESARLRDLRVGLAWTWPAGYMPLAVPIDHCLGGEAIGIANIKVLGDIGSDHYPLLIEITSGRNG